jgi:ATP-dependent Clp protease ATP-binding subunit ClpA
MLERFSKTARGAVTRARDEAQSLHDGHIGPEHLLLALLDEHPEPEPGAPPSVAAAVLTGRGVTAARVRSALTQSPEPDLDAEALASLGIDLEKVRAAAEASFGPGVLDPPQDAARAGSGRIAFGKPAKKVLELAVRAAVAERSPTITSGHLLIGVLGSGFSGAVEQLLAEAGVDQAAVRAEMAQHAGEPKE